MLPNVCAVLYFPLPSIIPRSLAMMFKQKVICSRLNSLKSVMTLWLYFFVIGVCKPTLGDLLVAFHSHSAHSKIGSNIRVPVRNIVLYLFDFQDIAVN